jgi:hypothetical protein
LAIYLYIYLSMHLSLYLSETKQFCDTSSKIGCAQLQREASLRDIFKKWKLTAPKRSLSFWNWQRSKSARPPQFF